jgi:tetratricopeptide (TPR) repeat protein
MGMNYLENLLSVAVDHHQAGRLADAEVTYRKILAAQPYHVDAQHLLGVLAGQLGDLDAGIKLIKQSLAIRPDFEPALRNLARLLTDKGEVNAAVEAYERVTQLSSREPSVWYALGLIYRRAERNDMAMAAFSTAIELEPKLAEAHNEIGKLHRLANRLDDAVEACARALSYDPNLADAHHTLANVRYDKDIPEEIDEMIAGYQRAAELAPAVPQYHASLGDAFCRKGQFTEAIGSFNTALILDPTHSQARHGAGVALCGLHRYAEAIELHKSGLELAPESAVGYQSYGDTLLANHDVAGAERCFRRAVELMPDISAFWVRLGSVLSTVGKFEESSSCFRRALTIDPNDVSAYKGLASISRAPANAEIERLTTLLATADLHDEDRIAADFGLGKLLDDTDRFDEAFERYAEGNLLYRNRCKKERVFFDADATRRQVDESIARYTPDSFGRFQTGDPSELPVFIVGMPRSGTTLVEQIIASHPKVFGAGELNQMANYASAMAAAGSPASWKQEKIRTIACEHLEYLQSLGSHHARVVDKMPGNIMNLGLIAMMFPGARVIFCHRDPRDNCLSCYFQYFKKHHLLFSYDLKDCATQYLEQERLKSHWLKTLPLRMMTVQYEELVSDLSGQSRQLIEFLGLQWDSACLDFHKNDRIVSTASVWQVRQPLYSSSVGRWRHYASHLEPLFNRLANHL